MQTVIICTMVCIGYDAAQVMLIGRGAKASLFISVNRLGWCCDECREECGKKCSRERREML